MKVELPADEHPNVLEGNFTIKGGIERFSIRKCFVKLDVIPEELMNRISIDRTVISTSRYQSNRDIWGKKLADNGQRDYSENKKLKCSICNHCVVDERDLFNHLKESHLIKPSFKCSESTNSTDITNDLFEHYKRVQENKRENNYSDSDECEVSKTQKLRYVNRVHSKDKPYKCSECDYCAVPKKK